MRIELPEGYQPPQPTHPHYGYLTPAERAQRRAEQQAEAAGSVADPDGMPDGMPEGGMPPERSPWSPPPGGRVAVEPTPEPTGEPPTEPAPALQVMEPEPELQPEPELGPEPVLDTEPVLSSEPELVVPHTATPAEVTPAEPTPHPVADPTVPPAAEEVDGATRPRPTGWVPAAPAPRARPRSVLGSVGEMRWDAYRQEWVQEPAPAAPADPSGPTEAAAPGGGGAGAGEEPPPDVAAAAGGRRSSSSWTSAEGRRYRWDARAQRWVVEGPDPS